MKWVEVSLEVDGEAAEAVAEVLNRYGHQGVAIEQTGFLIDTWEDEVPHSDKLIVRAYWAADSCPAVSSWWGAIRELAKVRCCCKSPH